MTKILFPSAINAGGFLGLIEEITQCDNASGSVILDISGLRSVSPAGLVAIAAAVTRWTKAGRCVEFAGLSACPILGYLQRMDLFKACGCHLPEKFTRHDPKGRFLEVQPIGIDVDSVAAKASKCLAPNESDLEHPDCDLSEAIQYVLTETANNVRQHSKGDGFVAAQVRSSEGLVRLAIADNGMGIRRTFVNAGFEWAQSCDDRLALEMALKPRVSSKGSPSNEGVGLTTTVKLAELFQGWFAVVSGDAYSLGSPGKPITIERMARGSSWRGTLCTIALKTEKVREFAEVLSRAKIAMGLLPPNFVGGRFTA